MRVRTLVPFATTLFSMCALGRADFRYTQSGQLTGGEVEASRGKDGAQPAPATVVTTSVKGSYLRIDLPDGSYGIIDLHERRELQVDPKNRTYSVMTFDEIRARNQAEEQESHAKGRDRPAPQFQQKNAGARMTTQVEVALTGRTQILLGQTALESKIELVDHPAGGAKSGEQSGAPAIEIKSWVAPSVSGFKEVRDFYAKLDSAIGWTPPDLTVPKGTVELLMAQEGQGYEQPVWVPLMTKGILDLSATAETSNALPMLLIYGLRAARTQQQHSAAKGNEQRRAAPNGAASGSSTSAASTIDSLTSGLTVRVTSYSAQTLDQSLFQVPSSYVETQSNPRNMWILAIRQM